MTETDIVEKLLDEGSVMAASSWARAMYGGTEKPMPRKLRKEAAAEIKKLRTFVSDVMQDSAWDGMDIDGGTLLDIALKHGVIERVDFDPEKHNDNGYGMEPGDDWYELTWTP